MEPVLHQAGLKVGRQGSLLVLSYERTPDRATAVALEHVGRDLQGTGLASTLILAIINGNHGPPDGTTRTRMASIQKLFEPQIRATAFVVLGEGFRAATIRTVLAGIHLLARVTYPVKVHAQIRSAMDWLAQREPTLLAPAGVPELAAIIRREYPPGPG